MAPLLTVENSLLPVAVNGLLGAGSRLELFEQLAILKAQAAISHLFGMLQARASNTCCASRTCASTCPVNVRSNRLARLQAASQNAVEEVLQAPSLIRTGCGCRMCLTQNGDLDRGAPPAVDESTGAPVNTVVCIANRFDKYCFAFRSLCLISNFMLGFFSCLLLYCLFGVN